MKKLYAVIIVLLLSVTVTAQIKKPLKTAADSVGVGRDVFTNLYFKATNGAKWPVYLEPSGKRYALRVSHVSRRYFKHYLTIEDNKF